MTDNRLTQRLEQIRSEGKPLFIPYMMCGDGGMAQSRKLLRLLEEADASAIEIGIPFSDPIADGPTISAAGQRSLDSGTDLRAVLRFLREHPIRNDVPRVIMSYLNPLLQFGLEAFFSECRSLEISGLILPDLPYEEFDRILPLAAKYGLHLIPLIAPGTGPDRMRSILSGGSGFVYAVTLNGTTGEGRVLPDNLLQRLSSIRQATSMPVVAGFGISDRTQIEAISSVCDGVVVGSRIVSLAHENRFEEIRALMTGE